MGSLRPHGTNCVLHFLIFFCISGYICNFFDQNLPPLRMARKRKLADEEIVECLEKCDEMSEVEDSIPQIYSFMNKFLQFFCALSY